MTAAEASALVVDLTRELAAERSRTAAYRLVACQGLHQLHAQHLELVRVREKLAALCEELRRYTATTIQRTAA
jgi:hypothetical protein